MVRHEGASLLAVVYSITGIDVIKAPPDLGPKGWGGQEHGERKAEQGK